MLNVKQQLVTYYELDIYRKMNPRFHFKETKKEAFAVKGIP